MNDINSAMRSLFKNYKKFRPIITGQTDDNCEALNEVKHSEAELDTCGLIDALVMHELINLEAMINRLLNGNSPIEVMHNVAHMAWLLGRLYERQKFDIPAIKPDSEEPSETDLNQSINDDVPPNFADLINGLDLGGLG